LIIQRLCGNILIKVLFINLQTLKRPESKTKASKSQAPKRKKMMVMMILPPNPNLKAIAMMTAKTATETKVPRKLRISNTRQENEQ